MNKWKIALSFLLIFTFLATPALAANNDKITVSMDGKSYSVEEIPVVIDGQAIYSDIPTFIHPVLDYTLVPIRFLVERYGAEVNWDQKTKTATVLHEGKEIKITINSEYIYVDGEKRDIVGGTTPKLVTFSNKESRTMVPLRVVSEALGFEVGWDRVNRLPYINTNRSEEENGNENINKKVISNVIVGKGSTNIPKITIAGNEELNYTTTVLKDPNRLVIDLEDAVLDLKDNISFEGGVGKIEVNSYPIEQVSISQFSSSPDVVRIVVNLMEERDFDIFSSDDGKSLTLSFVNRVKGIESQLVDGKEALIIHSAEKPEVKTFNLFNPTRIVIDLLDSSLEGGTYFSYDYNIGFIKGIRVSQFKPDGLYKAEDRIVRLVLDIKEGISDPNVSIDWRDNNLIVIPQTSLGEVIDYFTDGKDRLVTINAKEKTGYDIEYAREDNIMIITMPSKVLDIEEGYMNIGDGLINDITLSKEDLLAKITIKFRRGVEYRILSDEIDEKISLNFNRAESVKPSDRIIVIDPGHGGSDPGAVHNGTKEKDVNLKVSLKLNDRLRELGYNTIMTRDSDISVERKERAMIANYHNADLFISIHSNSYTASPNVSGIQVLYHAHDKAKVKKEETVALAKIMLEELVKGTGAADKGIIPRERTVVIRDTEMPSVLIELGFLTNEKEAQLLNDDEYQNILVESIIKGIEKYFDLY
ncbi:N-acetylmuramoyl-L-alanine amidase family protein [Tepidimicrobium xylanilyticum]|uniref:N-acetylmuramoyl-L-alanine amidase family protein n=1 Tax=Tepidimicrobium xylanilyticum TaxID=1123352 RepID=UPI00264FE718|nr:N-acetylmuramoyl-L-alanine amidase family protein [Tepidimicrobium xylanilyticum]GMG95830.1 hypothetical protein EN5CB1_06560 [Tepidimicrobium xylanilyticum]